MSTPSITVGQLLGHYRLIERIGGGGQGEVFRAHDERFDKDVALKILPLKVLADAEAHKRFRHEALAVGRLSHPNVATAFYFGEENGIDFLVTEYVSGTGLDEKLEQGPIPESDVLALGIQLASGLEAAHREGIIHRDLKPGNLRITQNGDLKILDFGLAELVDSTIDVASAETITINMTLTGTLPYMAPEQFGGVSDQRTDLWSAGAVLYEMATGKLPFPETQLQKLKDAILRSDPAPPSTINPNISQGLEQVILRCLQKEAGKRYQNATQLREALVRVAQGRGVKSGDWVRGKGFAVALLALVMATSALAVYHFWPQIRDRLWPQPPGSRFHVLAVLPIETNSQDAAENALVRGVAETVSARIAQGANGRELQLIPPNELSAHKVKSADDARREFGVERMLTVALQRSGDKVRVTYSLIDSKTHHQLDARTVTGDASDLFALEDNAVGEVFAMLPPDARSRQPEAKEVYAASPAGYEFYLKGRGYLLDYYKPENIDSAIKQFEQALKASPNYAPAYAGLGEAYWRGYRAHRGKMWLDLATMNCEKALGADPHMAEAHSCLGNLYNDTGHYDKGVDEFNRALALDKTNVQAFRGLGDAYSALGKTADAEETYKKAIAARPQYWAVYNWLGIFFSGQARYAEAAPMFEKVIELTPDNYRGYYDLGGVLELEGKYNEAIEALNHSIKLFPTMDAYSNLGAAYFWQHRYSDAVPAFEKARTLDDQDYLNSGNLGDALYWAPGRRPEAAAAYKRAIELAQAQLQVNPKDATARAYVAEYSAMLGDKSTALEQIRQASQLAPKDPDVMFRAGLVYNQLGDKGQTLQWLKKSIDGNYSRTVIRDTPDFAHLQADPEFKALIAAK